MPAIRGRRCGPPRPLAPRSTSASRTWCGAAGERSSRPRSRSTPVRCGREVGDDVGGRGRREAEPRRRGRGGGRRAAGSAAASGRPAFCSRLPTATTSSEPAISTGCTSATGRPSRRARQSANTTNAIEQLRRGPSRTLSGTRSESDWSPSPAPGFARSRNATRVPARGTSDVRGERGVVLGVEPVRSRTRPRLRRRRPSRRPSAQRSRTRRRRA